MARNTKLVSRTIPGIKLPTSRQGSTVVTLSCPWCDWGVRHYQFSSRRRRDSARASIRQEYWQDSWFDSSDFAGKRGIAAGNQTDQANHAKIPAWFRLKQGFTYHVRILYEHALKFTGIVKVWFLIPEFHYWFLQYMIMYSDSELWRTPQVWHKPI